MRQDSPTTNRVSLRSVTTSGAIYCSNCPYGPSVHPTARDCARIAAPTKTASSATVRASTMGSDRPSSRGSWTNCCPERRPMAPDTPSEQSATRRDVIRTHGEPKTADDPHSQRHPPSTRRSHANDNRHMPELRRAHAASPSVPRLRLLQEPEVAQAGRFGRRGITGSKTA